MLAYELQTVVPHDSIPVCVRIDSLVFSRSVAIQHHAKAQRLPVGGWAEDKVQVSCMEAEDDLVPSSFERSRLFMVEPLSSESPFIELEVCRLHVDMIGIPMEAALRCEMLSASIANIGFGGRTSFISAAAWTPCPWTLAMAEGIDFPFASLSNW
jgi:hypothetical protein